MAQGPGERPDEPVASKTPRVIRAAIAETRHDLARHLGALKDHLLHPLPSSDPPQESVMATKKKTARSSTAARGRSSQAQTAPKTASKAAAPAKPARARPAESKAVAARETSSKKEAPAASLARSRPGTPSVPSAASKSTRRKSAGSSPAKPSRKRAPKGVVQKTGEVLDTLLAGAVVGAVTGAALSLSHEPGAVPPSGGEIEPATSPSRHREGSITGEVLGEMAPGAALGAVTGAAKAVLPSEPAKHGTAKKKGPARR